MSALADYHAMIARKGAAFTPHGLVDIPALHPDMFPHQKHGVEFALRAGCSALFYDCVAGETIVETITGPERIDRLAFIGKPIFVWSIGDDQNPKVSRATSPFAKGTADLFEVKTAGGRSITVTAGHKFRSQSGWLFCHELAVGTRLLVSDACRHPTNSEPDHFASPQDVRRLLKTVPDFQERCDPGYHRYGAQPHQFGDSGLVSSPLQDDVPEHAYLSSRVGDLAKRLTHSHHRRNIAHHSTMDFYDQGSCASGELQSQLHSSDLAESGRSIQNGELSHAAEALVLSAASLHPWEYHVASDVQSSPWSLPFTDTVVSIAYVRTDVYYDMHVPGDQNYLAHGFWNHNTGLGKSLCALEWGRIVVEHTRKPVLMLAPLAVAHQHEREAQKFGIDAQAVRSSEEMGVRRIYITNYDRLDKFNASVFGGVILDESSVIKNMNGKTTRKLIESFANTPFRLCCTATPAPNDHTELGQHAEFLGVMRSVEMLPIWFINDTMDTGTWRLKRHARESFWAWVASWARCVSHPSDLGFDDGGFALPICEVTHHVIDADRTVATGAEKDGQFRLFRIPDTSATAIHTEKRLTIEARAERVALVLARDPEEPWVVWVDTDYEADAVMARIKGSGVVEVRGSQKPEEKERRLIAFSDGRERVMVSKPVISGYGLNWQHCARHVFAGLSFSYENYYQAIRRSWRFGQKRVVEIHVVTADTEMAIKAVIDRKGEDHEAMKREMVAAMLKSMRAQRSRNSYQPQKEAKLPAWVTA